MYPLSAWLVAKDISKLLPHEIESYINEPYKKSGELLAGYRIALDPKKWEEEREAISFEAVQEEANAEIDQLESENDGEPKKTKSKKRKRDSEPASAKPKKAPKAKKDSAEPTKKKSVSTVSKAKKNGTKSKAMVESEDEGDADADDDDAGPSKKVTPPPPKKAKREKEDENDDGTFLCTLSKFHRFLGVILCILPGSNIPPSHLASSGSLTFV